MLGPRWGARTSYSPQQAGWQAARRGLNLGVCLTVGAALVATEPPIFTGMTPSGQWAERAPEPTDMFDSLEDGVGAI